MNRTPQQQAIIERLVTSTANIAVVARAGCGKTTTIIEAIDEIVRAKPTAEITVCAFNKAIADEVSDKLKRRGHNDWRRVQASTIHSMGLGLFKAMFKPKVDANKVREIIRTRFSDEEGPHPLAQQIAQLVRLAKSEGFGFFDDRQINDVAAWYRMADHYDVNGFDDTTDLQVAVEIAQQIYQMSLHMTEIVDFDDMILFPLVKNLRVRFQRDYLFIDEAQDTSRARQALARKFVKRTGQVIIVGDDKQAIYGFSGADADALNRLCTELSAERMPLNVTWRCPKKVVELAQQYVPDIQAADSAIDGEIITGISQEDLFKTADKETAVLCRNTAPLITLAYSLLRSGKPCKVEGRDIGQGLKVLLDRWKVKTIDAFLNKLDAYQDREVQKAQAKGNEAKIEQVVDKCETLREIAKAVTANGKKGVVDMKVFIDDLFADGADNVTVLATYHRSKGREWPRVVLFEHAQRCPSRMAKQPWQLEQENNLAYVAITRSQRELVFYG